jgi:hypothetical protein
MYFSVIQLMKYIYSGYWQEYFVSNILQHKYFIGKNDAIIKYD